MKSFNWGFFGHETTSDLTRCVFLVSVCVAFRKEMLHHVEGLFASTAHMDLTYVAFCYELLQMIERHAFCCVVELRT